MNRAQKSRVSTAVAAIGVVSLGIGATACTSTADSAGTGMIPLTVSTMAPPADVVAAPEGLLEAALAELPTIIAEMMQTSGVPGAAVAVVQGDTLLYSEGFGVREVGKDEVVDAETVFQVASVSKPIGATVVATQVAQGVVGWNDRVIEHLPDFALADPAVTASLEIADLYSHRSGLPHAAGDDLEDLGFDRSTILQRLRLQPLDPFRMTYNYANFGITAGAEAVATAAGVPWNDLSKTELYDPLGMNHTSSSYDDFLKQPNRATLHALVGDEFQPLYERDADEQSPAGGVSSTVLDLATWMSMVLGEGTYNGTELISADALIPALTPQMISGTGPAVDSRAGHYGYGFNVGSQAGGRVSLSHSGAFATGAGTNFVLIPSLDLGIVTLSNGAPIGLPEAINAAFLDLVQFGHIERDWLEVYNAALAPGVGPEGDLVGQEPPADAASPSALTSYVGTYSNDYYGYAVVSVVDGALQLALGPDGASTVILDPWDGDTFSFAPSGENAPDGSLSSAAFRLGEDTEATLTVGFYNGHGLGTWVRRDG